jgi:spore coat polysaccharide biosynthesis protein SpsF
MKRRLVAAIACRNKGSRLYGKPLQNLDSKTGTRILDNILDCLATIDCIDEVVLGISHGSENVIFGEIAEQRGIKCIFGDEIDVLSRLIACGDAGNATDIFRITSESPFLYFEAVQETWDRHVAEEMDATFLWNIIDGSGFEILSLAALKKSHAQGETRHRSELCSLYIRENLDQFKYLKLDPPPQLARHDLRLTVDYPEDLVICREVYQALKHQAPRIRLDDIVRFLDEHPDLIKLTSRYAQNRPSLFHPAKTPPKP